MPGLALFVILQVLDVLSTLHAFSLGGGESNPLVSRMLTIGPVTGLVVAKLIVTGLASTLVRMGGGRGLRVINLAYSGVVLWNVSVILRLMLQR
jgi:hypothetical protein